MEKNALARKALLKFLQNSTDRAETRSWCQGRGSVERSVGREQRGEGGRGKSWVLASVGAAKKAKIYEEEERPGRARWVVVGGGASRPVGERARLAGQLRERQG